MKDLRQRIGAHPFLRDMPPEHIATLSEHALEMSFAPDTLLFREGEPASQFYLIDKGAVALEVHIPSDGTSRLEVLGDGEALGWSWLFPPFVWQLQARILEPTTAIVMDGAHLLVKAERDPRFGYQIMKRVSQMAIRRLKLAHDHILSLEFPETFAVR